MTISEYEAKALFARAVLRAETGRAISKEQTAFITLVRGRPGSPRDVSQPRLS